MKKGPIYLGSITLIKKRTGEQKEFKSQMFSVIDTEESAITRCLKIGKKPPTEIEIKKWTVVSANAVIKLSQWQRNTPQEPTFEKFIILNL